MDGFLLGLASFGLVLIPLVIIHEFGHFIAAKLSGITVLEFGIGFPPRAKILFTKGETIYTLNWLPIGGFVRPYGEDFVRPKSEEELSGDRQEIIERGITNPKSVFQATPWQRMFFMAAGPGINFLTALVLFIVVALVGQPYNRADVTIYEVLPGSPAEMAGLQPGDVIVEANGEKVESADDFNDFLRSMADQQVTLVIERDGAQQTIELTASVVDSLNIERAYVTGLFEDMPAIEAGIEVEDVIVAVREMAAVGEPETEWIDITSVEQLQNFTAEREGVSIDVMLQHGTETKTVSVTPKELDGQILMGISITGVKPAVVGLTAINQDTERYTRALPLGEAIKTGTDQFITAHELLVEFVDDLISGNIAPEAARPVSPVGIGQIGGPVLEQSLDEGAMYPIVLFAAMISIALAITNLLPIPGLDGGRILFVIIELIRGKPMEPEQEGVFHFIGLLFLLGLIAITVINDIVNPIDINNLR